MELESLKHLSAKNLVAGFYVGEIEIGTTFDRAVRNLFAV
jgi:hypothetical protein